MGILEFLLICVGLVLLAAFAVWVIGYFSPSPVPAIIPRVIWGAVILIIFVLLAQALGLFGHDIEIPRLR